MTLELDPRATALVLIDLQNGIVGMRLAPYDGAAVVSRAVSLGDRLKQAGGIVALVRVAFAPDQADRLAQPVEVPATFGTAPPSPEWSELVPEVAGLKPEIVVTKRQWGAFHGTEMDLQLRRRGITTVVLGGIATNFGVESTAREAYQHNYTLIVAEDCCASVSVEMHRFSIEKIMPRIARVRPTAEILASIGG